MSSLVTRCPACTTLFKVVPDQLRISEGWVRCGQCDEVFDANAHMQAPLSMQREAEPNFEESPSHRNAPAEAVVASQPDDSPITAAVVEPPSEVIDQPALEDSSKVEASIPSQEALGGSVDAGQMGWEGLSAESNDSDVPQHAPSFLQGGRIKPSPARASRRTKLLALLLVLLLVVQWIVHERDQLAAMHPKASVVLERSCEWLGCRVQPLRKIDSLAIESSSFVKIKSDVYRLSFVVRNTANWPLAIPAAELTLTDLHDQSVLRRVLLPAEFSGTVSTLSPGGELPVVVPISVKASADLSEKINGYRLLVFYP